MKSNPQSSNRSFYWPAVAQVAGVMYETRAQFLYILGVFFGLLIGNNSVLKSLLLFW